MPLRRAGGRLSLGALSALRRTASDLTDWVPTGWLCELRCLCAIARGDPAAILTVRIVGSAGISVGNGFVVVAVGSLYLPSWSNPPHPSLSRVSHG